MSTAARFEITGGAFALAVVDTAAVGYLDAWQAPAGKAIDTVLLADYTDAVAQWSCQINAMTIDPSANTNDQTLDPTWCAPSEVRPSPGLSSFAINGTYVHDAHVDDSLQAFLYLNDSKEAFFAMGLAGWGAPPMAIGRCRIQAAQFGGAGYVALAGSTPALPLTRRYDMWHGASPGTVIEGLTNTTRPGVVTVAAMAAAAVELDDDAELVA